MNDEGVCRTAPATPGLLNIYDIMQFEEYGIWPEVSIPFVSE